MDTCQNFARFRPTFAGILCTKLEFCRNFPIRPRRNVRGLHRVPGGYPTGSPQFAFSRKTPHTAPPKKLASSSARPQAAALRDLQRRGTRLSALRRDGARFAADATAGPPGPGGREAAKYRIRTPVNNFE